MKYGYLRVSTDKQNYERQLFVLQGFGLDKIFEEKITGTKKACGRENFEKMIAEIKKGDEVYFESMSRMARSMQDLIDTTNFIVEEKKAKVVFIKENLSIGNGEGLDAMGSLIFNIMGAFAQFERDLTADRTKQALSAKKAQGIKLGKPEKLTAVQKADMVALKGKMDYFQIAEMFGVSRSTVARVCANK